MTNKQFKGLVVLIVVMGFVSAGLSIVGNKMGTTDGRQEIKEQKSTLIQLEEIKRKRYKPYSYIQLRSLVIEVLRYMDYEKNIKNKKLQLITGHIVNYCLKNQCNSNHNRDELTIIKEINKALSHNEHNSDQQ